MNHEINVKISKKKKNVKCTRGQIGSCLKIKSEMKNFIFCNSKFEKYVFLRKSSSLFPNKKKIL